MKTAARKKPKVNATKKSLQTKTRRLGSEESTLRVTNSGRRSPGKPSLITLLTDFGSSDYFVAAMKGVILSTNPAARIVDIAHDIPGQDIEAAAFTLLAAHTAFPKGTIHIAVVDPGVGSDRRAILIKAAGRFFVGPDNGVFSYIYELAEPKVFHVTDSVWFRRPVSETFHGRDVFAPIASWLSLGITAKRIGNEISDYVRLQSLRPDTSQDGVITGRVIHIDHFGNCVTNITERELTDKVVNDGFSLTIQGQRIDTLRRFFAEGKRGKEIFCVWGSAGFLEIVAKNQSAAKLLQAKRGDSVILTRS